MKFKNIINEINIKIRNFNQFIEKEYRFTEIDISNPKMYSDTLQGQWGGEHWANKDSYGVYILFGYNEQNPEQIGIYIGKASQQFIGHRLFRHFRPHREMLDYYKMMGETKITFYSLCTLSTINHESRSLASSLEEFLISGGFDSASLVNKVGKKQ